MRAQGMVMTVAVACLDEGLRLVGQEHSRTGLSDVFGTTPEAAGR